MQETRSDAANVVAAYIAVWNGADDTALDTLLSPDFHRTGDPLSESAEGPQAVRGLVRKMRLDMPDLEVTILDAIYTADRAALHWQLSGTDSGPGDFPPTDRAARVYGLALFRLKEGRLVEEVMIMDGVSLLGQLGFTITPPARAP